MDDATSDIYSAFFVAEEGTMSSFQGVSEAIRAKGLFCSLYADRASHYWNTVSEWQNRPLDACYAIVFFDAIRVKIRDEGFVRNKAVYIALAILPDGTKEILGLWIEQTEGAKFWLRVMNELKNRGVQDILLAVVDGLKGFPEAINATFPRLWFRPVSST